MTWLLVAAFLGSLFLTGLFRRYAIVKQILDVPNHRSSHLVATPRGGGLVFSLSFLLIIFFLNLSHWLNSTVALAIGLPGFLIVILGFVDDRKSISPKIRLVLHFISSFFALYFLGGMPPISLFNGIVLSGIGLNLLAFFYLVWLVNLYNFMDGIDGLAAIEAISVCFGAALLYWMIGAYEPAYLLLILLCLIAGFLYWNVSPAKIFMGDSGSGFLGMTLGVLSIYASTIKADLFWSWLILLGVFIVDATLTLFYRAFHRKPLIQAHRSHAYQHASLRFNSHFLVSLTVLLINCFWLFPFAMFVAQGRLDGFYALTIAYAPLIVLCIYFKSGKD